jgi:hypothetical protein
MIFSPGFPSRAPGRDTLGHARKTKMEKDLEEFKVALKLDKGVWLPEDGLLMVFGSTQTDGFT